MADPGVSRRGGTGRHEHDSEQEILALYAHRTGVTVNGTPTPSQTYDAVDQVAGWTYDDAGFYWVVQ
jgi:hypothetical protein